MSQSLEVNFHKIELYQTPPSPPWVKLKINYHEFSFYPEDFKVFVAWLNVQNEMNIKLEKTDRTV